MLRGWPGPDPQGGEVRYGSADEGEVDEMSRDLWCRLTRTDVSVRVADVEHTVQRLIPVVTNARTCAPGVLPRMEEGSNNE